MTNILKNKSILVVEDEQEIAELVKMHLRDFGVNVKVAPNGNCGMEYAFKRRWDLIVLDIQLPGPSGLDICRNLREEQNNVPILLLTSRSSETDMVVGLEIGADDYMAKPFGILALIARTKALLRRVDSFAAVESETSLSSRINIRSLTIDEKSRQVQLGDRKVDLTAKEFDLLLHFAKKPGQVFRRAELLDSVWGYGHEGYEHTVNSHINRLRTKLERDPANPEYVVTVWGVGYKMDHDAARV